MSMSLIVQAEKYTMTRLFYSSICNYILSRYFLLSDGVNISIYSYEGRLVATPKLMGSKPDSVNANNVSLSPDTIAVRDSSDTKCMSKDFRVHESYGK